jgi:transcriptional regulator with XRE-family HTH domain
MRDIVTAESGGVEVGGQVSILNANPDLTDFLRGRRARLKPEDVGLPEFGRRRVSGLRREEIAQLAGVSAGYYTRLEQGNARNVSAEVLSAIATALQLSEVERVHFIDLARQRPAARTKVSSARGRQKVRADLIDMIESFDPLPAYVWGRRGDILAWNPAAASVFGFSEGMEPEDRNWARIIFLNPDSRDVYVDWESKAASVVGQLRLDAGGHPDDPLLLDLLAGLESSSSDFRRLWSEHGVKQKTSGTVRVRARDGAQTTLRFETLAVPNEEQSVSIYLPVG